MALSNLALYGGAFFTPVVVGVMTSTIGWRWTFYLVGILSAVTFPMVCYPLHSLIKVLILKSQ